MSDGRQIVSTPRRDPIKAYTMGGIVSDAGLTVEEPRHSSWKWPSSDSVVWLLRA